MIVRLLESALVLLLLVGPPAAARAQERTISLNHKRIEIARLAEQVGTANERTILLDERVRGSVSIVAKRPVTVSEAWLMFETALSITGFSLLPSTEGNWRIAPVAEAVGESPFEGSARGASDSFVTTLIPLRHAPAQEILDAIQPLAGARVTLVPYAPTNSLIASGPERAIARLVGLSDELDQIAQRDMRFRVLRYRTVAELEPIVEAHLETGALVERDLSVWSDERTNSVIYRGTERQAERLEALIDRIDRPAEGAGRIRILKVLYRDPEEVAELIRQLSQPAAAEGDELASDVAIAGAALTGLDYSIVVDPKSRSLVVQADAGGHEAIREVLEIIDQQPQLIAVDIKVAQVRTPRSYSLGFAFDIPLSPGDDVGEVIARWTNIPAGAGLLNEPGEETTVFGRVARDAGIPFTIDDGTGVEIPIEDTGVLDGGELRAFTEILIEPSLIITAGDEHRIFAGDNVPVPVGRETDPGAAGPNTLSTSSTIERQDVGVDLSIEAKAGREGRIQLDLALEISRVVESLAGSVAAVGPTFATQKLTVAASLNDGEIATVATAKERMTVRGQTGTPFFKDIPFFGWLFKRDFERDDDQRLVVTAQARRVGSPAELVADSIRRRLAFERRNARDLNMPSAAESPYAVLVTTRGLEGDARAIAESLKLRGLDASVHRWRLGARDLFDVYVTAFGTMAEAAGVASGLYQEGWETDLVILPQRS